MTTTTTETATSPVHLMSLFAQRAAAGDVEGLLALYEPGAVFEPQIGTVLRGTEAIRSASMTFAGMCRHRRAVVAHPRWPGQPVAETIRPTLMPV